MKKDNCAKTVKISTLIDELIAITQLCHSINLEVIVSLF